MNLLSLSFWEDSRDCVALMRENGLEQEEVTAALDRLITYMEHNGVTYGVMVRDYYLPDGINEQLCIGDVIISLNGTPCGSLSTYMQMKNNLTEKNYTMEVLRADDSSQLRTVTLQMSTDMPRVQLTTVVYDGTDF